MRKEIVLSTKTEAKNNNIFKYLLYMGIVIGFATYAAACADIILSIVSAAVGGGFFAAVCMRKFNVLALIPMMFIPPIVVYLVTSELILSLMAISFLPVGITIFYGMRKNLTRSQTIVRTVLALGAFYALIYSSIIVQMFGALNVQTIRIYLEWNFEIVRQYMVAVENAYIENGLDVTQYFPEGMLEEAVLSLKLSVLGYIIAFLSIVSYAATMVAKSASLKLNAFRSSMGEWKFVLSKAGAFVFVLAYLAQGFYSADTEGLYFPFAMNTICVSLYPGIIYMGVRKIAKKFSSGAGGRSILFLAIALALFGAYIALLLLVVGLYATFTYKADNNTEGAQ